MENISNEVVVGTTCFAEHEKRNVACQKKVCRQWMSSSCNMNCTLIALNQNEDGLTLQQIGDIFEVTRMRICQLEKASIQKISLD